MPNPLAVEIVLSEDEREVVDVGLQVAPEVAAGAPAAGADLGGGDAHVLHDLQGIPHAEGDALEEGSDEHVAGGAGGELLSRRPAG